MTSSTEMITAWMDVTDGLLEGTFVFVPLYLALLFVILGFVLFTKPFRRFIRDVLK